MPLRLLFSGIRVLEMAFWSTDLDPNGNKVAHIFFYDSLSEALLNQLLLVWFMFTWCCSHCWHISLTSDSTNGKCWVCLLILSQPWQEPRPSRRRGKGFPTVSTEVSGESLLWNQCHRCDYFACLTIKHSYWMINVTCNFHIVYLHPLVFVSHAADHRKWYSQEAWWIIVATELMTKMFDESTWQMDFVM